jgi:hypothetical protein
MSSFAVLSYIQARAILAAREAGQPTREVSLDLGRTLASVQLAAQGIRLPDGQQVAWAVLADIADDEATCYRLEEGRARKLQVFSEQFNRFYSLMPTEGAPTVVIAGFPMHRIKGTDPQQDTRKKLRAIGSLRGAVLDTTTGLGYTAIAAARSASHVTTIELDPATLEIARYNPWSRELFASSTIEQVVGDAFEVLQELAPGSFSRVIHDPPTFSLAGELYSGAFYRQLFRVLKPNGRVFHYIGSLESKSGQGVARGVIRRLAEAGFSRVVRKPEAFGVVAYK